ncbi:pyruvate formate-lyase-activating protein [Pantanalinema sp. GBBB05]|uniref:pyruvate formate-lyase-activating protein n=1 Tax=Pantanalinema sp. GBBB05 TaxID=2604139 RepID=UPI001D59701C|nr:pyruvate formate lyase-activating protein [Pantanalinema sp. GBBB05]
MLSHTLEPTVTTVTGQIHSIETCGTVDGPGIRFVIFTQGCPLRCLYCHNPDCRQGKDGAAVTVEQLMTEIQSYASYLKPPGGVTISGGEPLMQPEFVQEVFRQCKLLGFHTTLDTSGFVNLNTAKSVLEQVDLVLLDIKSFDPEIYTKVTNVSIEPTLELAKYLNQLHKPTWIRFVLVPGLTDDRANVEELAKFIADFTNVERVEILPFHKMGEYKWEQLGYEYHLYDTAIPTPEQVQTVVEIFQQHGIPTIAA